MEVKMKHSQMSEASKRQAMSFIRDLKVEISKITWTTKPELVFCTKLVVGATFVLGLGIYISDLLIKGGLDAISATIRFIFG